jgi:MSHA biogenesis protein MshQ
VDWTGQINLPISGNWTFGLELNGQAQLLIDNQAIINAIEVNQSVEGQIALSEGRHRITLHFLDNVGGSLIHLYWITPLGEKLIVPTTALEPSP